MAGDRPGSDRVADDAIVLVRRRSATAASSLDNVEGQFVSRDFAVGNVHRGRGRCGTTTKAAAASAATKAAATTTTTTAASARAAAKAAATAASAAATATATKGGSRQRASHDTRGDISFENESIGAAAAACATATAATTTRAATKAAAASAATKAAAATTHATSPGPCARYVNIWGSCRIDEAGRAQRNYRASKHLQQCFR